MPSYMLRPINRTRTTRATVLPVTTTRRRANFRKGKLSLSAEVWDAALPSVLLWALASVAAWASPTLLQWGWLLAWRSEWQWASLSVSGSVYRLPPQQECRRDPNQRRCWEGLLVHIESN